MLRTGIAHAGKSPGGEVGFVKIQYVIPLMLLVGCCVVGAQTTNTLTNTNTSSLLTKEQAESLAKRLAIDRLKDTPSTSDAKCEKSQEDVMMFFYNIDHDWLLHGNTTSTLFVDGHWVSRFYMRDSHFSKTAIVELAPDGSTNSVVAYKHGGLP